MFLNEEFLNLYEELSNLNEAKTGIPYKGYIICYGCHNTDRWYIKDSYENFLGTKFGYSTEKEAQEEIDEIVKNKNLSESRSIKEIENEIYKLQQELEQARTIEFSEKSTTLAGKKPEVLYMWDMYIDKNDKGSWTSASKGIGEEWDGQFFETVEKAISAGQDFLADPANKDFLDGDINDYIIDTVSVPLSELSNDILEFNNLEHLISDGLSEDYEVYVEGESYIMPEIFYNTKEEVDTIIHGIKGADIDSYDDHYFDGEQMQWRSMWNIFEPITFDIDKLEKKLKTFVTSKNTIEYNMDIDFDRDMFEDEGVLNICLSLEAGLL